jgi:multidrug efflux pump
MIGVTFFGLFLTPVFYTVIRNLGGDKPIIAPGESQRPQAGPSN